MQVLPYFSFEGNAAEAMELYKKAFNGKTTFTIQYKENEDLLKKYPQQGEYLFHAEVKIGDDYFYLCDLFLGTFRTTGTHIDVHINFKSVKELERAFDILKEKGQIKTELYDTFWGARYGAVTDKFGNGWSLNYQYPKK